MAINRTIGGPYHRMGPQSYHRCAATACDSMQHHGSTASSYHDITGQPYRQRSTSSIEGGYAVTGDIHRGNIVSMPCQRQCNAWCCGTQRVTAVVSCAGIHPRTEKAPRISLYPLDAPRFFLRAYGASPASGHDLRWSRVACSRMATSKFADPLTRRYSRRQLQATISDRCPLCS